MAAGCKKTSIARQSSYTSQCLNPLIEQNHHRSSSDGGGSNPNGTGVSLGAHIRRNLLSTVTGDNKENAAPNVKPRKMCSDENEDTEGKNPILKEISSGKSQMKDNLLKPSSLQLCMKKNEPDSFVGLTAWPSVDSEKSNSVNVWDYSDSEAAPVSSWSTLPNRFDIWIGFCCIIFLI